MLTEHNDLAVLSHHGADDTIHHGKLLASKKFNPPMPCLPVVKQVYIHSHESRSRIGTGLDFWRDMALIS